MMRDKRLLCVASLVRDGAALADIGTDHAYLPVYLMQNGRVRHAIASDIGEGPAASAREHIESAGLRDRIEVCVADGLSGVSPEAVTDIVIAGMGGETIITILVAAPWVKDARYRLVLQPMTKTVELRRYLYEQGFSIEEEHLVLDGRHLYCVMAVSFAKVPVPSDPLAPYIGALDREEGQPYFKQQQQYLQKRIAGLRRTEKSQDADALETVLAALDAYIIKIEG